MNRFIIFSLVTLTFHPALCDDQQGGASIQQKQVSDKALTEYSRRIVVKFWTKDGTDKVFITQREARLVGSGLEEITQHRQYLPLFEVISLPKDAQVIDEKNPAIKDVAGLRKRYPDLYKIMSEILVQEYAEKALIEKKNKKASSPLWKRFKNKFRSKPLKS